MQQFPQYGGDKLHLLRLPGIKSIIDQSASSELKTLFSEEWMYQSIIDGAFNFILWNIYPEEFFDTYIEGMFRDEHVPYQDLTEQQRAVEDEVYCELCRISHEVTTAIQRRVPAHLHIDRNTEAFLYPVIHRTVNSATFDVVLVENM